jgi:hypothetical protein
LIATEAGQKLAILHYSGEEKNGLGKVMAKYKQPVESGADITG